MVVDADDIRNIVNRFEQTNNRLEWVRAGGSNAYPARPAVVTAAVLRPMARQQMFADDIRLMTLPTRRGRDGYSSSNATGTTADSDISDTTSRYLASTGSTLASTAPSSHSQLPPDIAHLNAQLITGNGAVTLPCEFNAYLMCNQYFHPDDTQLWIEHIITTHLRDELPSISVCCWFCDDYRFDAEYKFAGDRRESFEARMHHIRAHILEERKTVHEMRPDFPFLKHLHQHGLVTDELYKRACEWRELPHHMEGIYNHDFVAPEVRKKMDREERIVHNLGKEDRLLRRRQKQAALHGRRH